LPLCGLLATVQDAIDVLDTQIDEVEEAVDGFDGPVRHFNWDSRFLGQFGKTCIDLYALIDL
jgi:hypothetical protein